MPIQAPGSFDAAVAGCAYVFHVASPVVYECVGGLALCVFGRLVHIYPLQIPRTHTDPTNQSIHTNDD